MYVCVCVGGGYNVLYPYLQCIVPLFQNKKKNLFFSPIRGDLKTEMLLYPLVEKVKE